MAGDITFRERNKVQWRGIRPAHNGDQIYKGVNGNNSAVIAYTVPAGKIFYLTGWTFSAIGTANSHAAVFAIRDDSDVLVDYLSQLRGGTNTGNVDSRDLFYPVEVPAGYDLYGNSNNAVCTWYLCINGWIEDA